MAISLYQQAKALYEQYDTRIGIGLMALGFVVDSLTLKRIDLHFENLILFSYLMIALVMIVLINLYHGGRLQFKFMNELHRWLPLPMQFAFGGLFSGYVIFYSRSGSLIASWPFLIMLVALLVGNEFSKTKYARFTYQLTVFYTALFSFTIFYIPVITKKMSAGMFVLSGVVSLVAIALVLLLIRKVAKSRFEHSKRSVLVAIASVFIVFNILYFTNIIPPIPLSMKSAGVYHSIQRSGDTYNATAEAPPWYRFYDDTSRVFHRKTGQRVYIYSSVFAPTDLRTSIFHQWYFYDESAREWLKRDLLSFAIVGGRDGGYRGFSRKRGVEEGTWRVDVITDRGQRLGRIKFKIVDIDPVRRDTSNGASGDLVETKKYTL